MYFICVTCTWAYGPYTARTNTHGYGRTLHIQVCMLHTKPHVTSYAPTGTSVRHTYKYVSTYEASCNLVCATRAPAYGTHAGVYAAYEASCNFVWAARAPAYDTHTSMYPHTKPHVTSYVLRWRQRTASSSVTKPCACAVCGGLQVCRGLLSA